MGPTLEATGISKTFTVRRDLLGRATERVAAVKDVSLRVAQSETLGLVGESGSGKSTTGRLIARLIEADTGEIRIDGTDFSALTGKQLQKARKNVQMVFQDPFSSLDPSWVVSNIVTEGLRSQGKLSTSEREAAAVELLELVGLGSHHLRRYPYEFSGGQRQRIAIARALALRPKLLICDEAVSALDVSTQASILMTLEELQDRLSLSYLFISHDLSVVRHLSDRIAVMYLGRIVESGEAAEIYEEPRHPYTRALLSAVPQVRSRNRPSRVVLVGDLPSASKPPAGCVFHPRCPEAMDKCREVVPQTVAIGSSEVACHLYPADPDHSGVINGGQRAT